MRAAVTLIERDGADVVSMRRVAAELGVGTMSLYNHVPNKSALLDGVAEFILSDMEFASGDGSEDGSDPDADWRDQARGLAHAFRDVARRYPRSVLVVITRQPRSTVGMRPVEVALAAVRRGGFDGQEAVRLVRTVVSFVLGSLVNEIAVTGARDTGAGGTGTAGATSAAERAELAGELSWAGFTNVRDLLPVLAEHDHDADFEFGLELLIGAMQALPRDG